MSELLTELAVRTGENRAQEYVATVASVAPLEVTFRGERVSVVNGMPWYCHVVGDQVRVIRSDEQLVIYATLAQLPSLATVSAYATGTANCSVVANDDTFSAQILGTGWTPAVGDKVGLIWTPQGPFALKRGGPVAAPADPPAPPDNMNQTLGADIPTPTPKPPTSYTKILYAQQTACYYDASYKWTSDQARYWLYCGFKGDTAVTGFWFYDDQPAQVFGATVTKAEVWLQRIGGGPSGARGFPLMRHSARTAPATEPSTIGLSDELIISLTNGQSGWFSLPTAWGQQIAAGTVRGLCCVANLESDPYKSLVGLVAPPAYPNAKNVLSGAIRLTYKRS